MTARPLLLVTAVSLAVQLALAAWVLATVGWVARVPIHWGIDGAPDGSCGMAVANHHSIARVVGTRPFEQLANLRRRFAPRVIDV